MKYLLLHLILITSVWSGFCQEPDDSLDFIPDYNTISDNVTEDIRIFTSDEPLIWILEFDMMKFMREKDDETYQEATLVYRLNDTVNIRKTIELKARGFFRKEYCSLPPIKIRFEKSGDPLGDLDKMKTLKLVTYCIYNKRYQQYVLKEYLAYKLYNLLTEQSFRVRLVKINYIDTGRRKPKEFSGYGFIIEDVDLMAERNNAMELKFMDYTIGQHLLDQDAMTRVALFQYMIGNPDWSVPNSHNMKYIRFKELSKTAPIPVPYDFDYSGLVNASYAIPFEVMGIGSVTERLYLGICHTVEEFREACRGFLDKKEGIYRTIREFEYLDEGIRKNLIRYIDGFFTVIESDKLLRGEILEKCR